MAVKKSKNTKDSAISDSKLFAFLAILLTVVGYIIIHFSRKHDKYAMYYAKQGLVIFVVGVIVSIISWMFAFVPVVGNFLGNLLWLMVLVLWVLGMIYALSGNEKDIPVIGEFAKKL
jgi:uncharacterized membrane protein